MGIKLLKKLKCCVALVTTATVILSTFAYGSVNTYASEAATPMDATAAVATATDANEQYIMEDSGSLVFAATSEEPSITYAVHCQDYGWMSPVSDSEMAGTTGEAKRLEAISVTLKSNQATNEVGEPLTGGIMYRTHVQYTGWQDWVSAELDGQDVSLQIDAGIYGGTMGMSRRLEGIEIKLTGELAEYYDVIYRTHVQDYGWMDFVSNGELSGTTGESRRLEAIEIALVKKNTQVTANLTYQVHAQDYGWMQEISPALGEYNTNTIAGTSGESRRLEAMVLSLDTTGVTGGVEYSTHVQNIGWMSPVSDGQMSGTEGEAKRVEAVTARLTGSIAAYYDIYYRVHVQNLGWLDWACNGQKAGTQGLSLRMEAIQFVLIEKGAGAPGATTRPFYNCESGNWSILPGALSIEVNKQMNCITIYKGSVAIKSMVCSTGYATPVGTFNLKSKWRWKELINDVYGQYSYHITGDILFHSAPYDDPNIYKLLTSEYNKLGQTASAGCIRLTTADAKWIYDNCSTGTKVVIYNSSNPGPLGKPTAQKLPYGQTWDPTDPLIN